MKPRQTLLDRLPHALLLIYVKISGLVSPRIWLFLGKGLGLFLYLVDAKHRNIVLANLRFAVGHEKSERELHRIARRTFQEFGMIGQEWVRLKKFDRKELDQWVSVEGTEHLRAAKMKNPAVILLGAHFGNWEFAHLFYARHFNKLNFIVRAIDNPFFERERVTVNNRFGVRILYKQNGLRTAIRHLKAGEDLVIFGDQKVSPQEGILCRFFGRETSMISILAMLSEKFRIPIVPMFIFRQENGLRHRLVFLPELAPPITGTSKEEVLAAVTQAQSQVLEAVIKKQPEQWIWFHRKWSYHYPEIYRN